MGRYTSRTMTVLSVLICPILTADNIGGSGINVISTVSQDFFDLVNDAVTGDRIIVAFTQPSAVVPPGSFTCDANHAEFTLTWPSLTGCATDLRCVSQ